MKPLAKPKTFRIQTKTLDLVVAITPDGMLRFRQPYKHAWVDLPLSMAYLKACAAAADTIISSRRSRK